MRAKLRKRAHLKMLAKKTDATKKGMKINEAEVKSNTGKVVVNKNSIEDGNMIYNRRFHKQISESGLPEMHSELGHREKRAQRKQKIEKDANYKLAVILGQVKSNTNLDDSESSIEESENTGAYSEEKKP